MENAIRLTYLTVSANRRKYNDVLMKALSQAGIEFETRPGKFGINLFVSANDFDRSYRIQLNIPLFNPDYSRISSYIK